ADRYPRRTIEPVMLVRIPYDRTAERVAALLAKKMETLPEFLWNSVTWDHGKEMPRTRFSPSRPELMSTSAIHTHPGSEGPSRTPTDCCGNTSRKEPTCPFIRRPSSTRSTTNSTTVHARHSVG